MKNILVLIHDDPGQEARLAAALDLTRTLGGHLTCLEVIEMPSAIISGLDDCGATATVLETERELESDNRARNEPRVVAADLPYRWIETTGYLGTSLRDAAERADLIVINRELDGHHPKMRKIAAEVLIGAARPVLAVPERAKGFDAAGVALVAWDGSEQADVALHAALPLLRHARTITLIEVEDGSIRRPAAEAIAYLAGHGIEAHVRHESTMFDVPSTVLLDAVDILGADYLVMGGFGHRPFVEAALGGVTRRMLGECRVPIFLYH